MPAGGCGGGGGRVVIAHGLRLYLADLLLS